MKSYPSYLVGQNRPGPRKRIIHSILSIIRKDIKQVRLNHGFLVAVREEDNAADEGAVAIYTQEPYQKLGYLPKKHHWVSDAIDCGTPVIVKITDVRRSGIFSRKYYVDLAITPVRPAGRLYKKGAGDRSKAKKLTSRAINDLQRFIVSAEAQIDAEIIKAENAENAIRIWAGNNKPQIEIIIDAGDQERLYDSIEIDRVDEVGEIVWCYTFSRDEISDLIDEGLNSEIEL
ncbi:MAG: hypothetical protein HXY25_00110 [Alphaproteobacteria bacterium]|nr:hypothetical protein [Alphaproteobacteria bacterium]